jgi:hypothetical protein
MPKQKDLKRLVRARMQKTGEAYTTARLVLTTKTAAPDYAKLAGMSDAAVKKATGSTWASWVEVLDRAKAREMAHGELAKHIKAHHRTPDWWTQMVAVGYERIRGLRAQGQRRSGEWEVSKSKTVAAPVAKVYAAFKTPQSRAKWLAGAKLTVRTAKAEKSMRVRFEDGSPVDVYFVPRSPAKCQVAVHHRKLTSKAEADRLRAFWGERLDELAARMK